MEDEKGVAKVLSLHKTAASLGLKVIRPEKKSFLLHQGINDEYIIFFLTKQMLLYYRTDKICFDHVFFCRID